MIINYSVEISWAILDEPKVARRLTLMPALGALEMLIPSGDLSGVGKCPSLGILNITLKYLLEIISPIVG